MKHMISLEEDGAAAPTRSAYRERISAHTSILGDI